MPNTKTSPHDDITLLVPPYVHTTCHNLQRHTEHMIRTYTARWHTYLVNNTEIFILKVRQRKQWKQTNTCLAEQFPPFIDAFQRFVYIAYKKDSELKPEEDIITRRHHHTTRTTLRTHDLPQPATTYRTYDTHVYSTGIPTWYNNTEALVVRVCTITKTMKAKKGMPCGAMYTIDAYQCFVYIAYKNTVSQSGENLVFPLYCCT